MGIHILGQCTGVVLRELNWLEWMTRMITIGSIFWKSCLPIQLFVKDGCYLALSMIALSSSPMFSAYGTTIVSIYSTIVSSLDQCFGAWVIFHLDGNLNLGWHRVVMINTLLDTSVILDIAVNKLAKDFLRNKFETWYLWRKWRIVQQISAPTRLGLPTLKELGAKKCLIISNNPQFIFVKVFSIGLMFYADGSLHFLPHS